MLSVMIDETLARIHVDLPNHWGTSGESLSAVPLGDDVYEVRNAPFYAYNINYGDHVVAVSLSPDALPEVQRVVKRSGHRTLRVLFLDMVPQERRMKILESLSPMHVTYEGATPKYFALDLAPDADIAQVRAVLDDLELQNTL